MTTGLSPAPDAEPLFEWAAEYETLLHQGTRLSGENRLFFVRGRVGELVAHLPPTFRPRRVLDFGCGLGDSSRHLADALPGADVVGVEPAGAALRWAHEHHGGGRVSFVGVEQLSEQAPFDLCYIAGVLHHVPPRQRPDVLAAIRSALAPGGLLALFENNPWNPGARMVMRRIPFDRHAIPLSPREGRRLVETCGFRCLSSRSLFYFPRPLAFLRRLEPLLAGIPLGAQYWLLSVKEPLPI